MPDLSKICFLTNISMFPGILCPFDIYETLAPTVCLGFGFFFFWSLFVIFWVLFLYPILNRLQMVWVFIMNRMSSQSSSSTQRRRMALGIVILLLVDVIWVASSELSSVSIVPCILKRKQKPI